MVMVMLIVTGVMEVEITAQDDNGADGGAGNAGVDFVVRLPNCYFPAAINRAKICT